MEGLPNPIVKDGFIEVWDRPGMGINLIPELTKPFLKEEDQSFFDWYDDLMMAIYKNTN